MNLFVLFCLFVMVRSLRPCIPWLHSWFNQHYSFLFLHLFEWCPIKGERWKAERRSTHGHGYILTAYKMTTSHSTIKCLVVLLENAPQISLFSTPKLQFEKGSKTQSFQDDRSTLHYIYNTKWFLKMLFWAT